MAKAAKWPGSMVSPIADEMEANLTYGLTNFSHNFINITFYNGSKLIANLTHSAEGFKVLITGENNESKQYSCPFLQKEDTKCATTLLMMSSGLGKVTSHQDMRCPTAPSTHIIFQEWNVSNYCHLYAI